MLSTWLQAADILDSSAAEGLMLDDSLAQSKMYFQLLHLLRIMPLWIRDTRYDLEKLGNDYILTVRTQDVVHQNWTEVMRRFGVFEKELQKRIGEKKDEITGLRDGVRKLGASMSSEYQRPANQASSSSTPALY
jgi:hypothetical protein